MNKGLLRKWSKGLSGVGIVCILAGLMLLADAPVTAQDEAEYMGIGECGDCHRDSRSLHRLSAHSLSLIDPVTNPELIAGDFEQSNPLLTIQFPGDDSATTITLENITYAVGSGRHYQQYLVDTGEGNYRVLPIAWNMETSAWESLTLADDWSDTAYDWNTQCTLCHVTGYDAIDNDWEDDGVQCEACHGPGSIHIDIVDEADWEIDDEEAVLIRESIISEPTVESCESCHNANLNDGIHQATVSFVHGETLLDEVAGTATGHATAEDAPDCISCHIGETVVDEETVTAHDMQMTAYDYSTQCIECHTDLTLTYAQRFISGQQDDTAQRLAIIDSVLDVDASHEWVVQAFNIVAADSSGGVHNVAYTESLLNAVEVELGLVEQTTLFTTNPVTNPEDCVECHEQEYNDWLGSSHEMASLNEHFQSVYSENGQPTYCLRCHASGFDSDTQSIQYEGVVCSTCHVVQGEHPPAPVTMGTNVTTCATCHSGGHASVYEEWLASEHSDAGVDCIDCHNAHTNEMLLGDVNTTCGDCHEGAMNDEVHMGEDLICTDCHMTPRQSVDDPTMLTQTGHSMSIAPQVCTDCHGEIHTLELSDEAMPDDEIHSVEELNAEIEEWQTTAEQNITSGLLGGAVGVILLLGLIYLVLRLGRAE